MKQSPDSKGQYISSLLQKNNAQEVNYSEPAESSPHPHTILSKRHFNIIFQSSPRLTKQLLSFKDFTFKYHKHCYLSHARCEFSKISSYHHALKGLQSQFSIIH